MANAPSNCANCGAALSARVLRCTSCDRLVFAAELEAIAQRARQLEASGEPAASAEVLRRALQYLPAESSEAAAIRQRIASLGAVVQAGAGPQRRPNWLKRLGPIGVALAFAFKFKSLALLALTKGKFLIFGLAKFKTLLSMFATMGLYWTLYGWKFGVGFVLGIYIHEMGHVWMLRHYGLRASAPMFIPGFGAFVSMYDSPANVGQDARIGLAGPLWGAAAALACLLPAATTGQGVWWAVANATAYINLFNLTPIWQLDGGRAFRALDRRQRFYLLGLMVVLWFLTQEGIFLILSAGAAFRVLWQKDHAPEADQGVLVQFAGLMLLFGAILALIPAVR